MFTPVKSFDESGKYPTTATTYASTAAYRSCFRDNLIVRGWMAQSSVLSPAPAEADLRQLSVLPYVVALKLFVLVHGLWPATPFVQNVGHFDKSRLCLLLCT
jgi:hypothetical protein